MKEGRNAMRSNKITAQINANVVAESLKKEFGVKRSDALNLFAQWTGHQDFGSLKSTLKASSVSQVESRVSPEDEAKYAILTFKVRNGELEDTHHAFFSRDVEGDTRTKEQFQDDIYCYALFFYDDLEDYIQEHFEDKYEELELEGLGSEAIQNKLKSLAVERALEQSDFGDGHFNRCGEISIEDVDVRFISKSDYELSEAFNRLKRGY